MLPAWRQRDISRIHGIGIDTVKTNASTYEKEKIVHLYFPSLACDNGRGVTKFARVVHVLKIVDLPDVRTNYVTTSLRPPVIKCSFTCASCVVRLYVRVWDVIYEYKRIDGTHTRTYLRTCVYACGYGCVDTFTHVTPIREVRGTESREFRLWIAREWPRGSRHMLAPRRRTSFMSLFVTSNGSRMILSRRQHFGIDLTQPCRVHRGWTCSSREVTFLGCRLYGENVIVFFFLLYKFFSILPRLSFWTPFRLINVSLEWVLTHRKILFCC